MAITPKFKPGQLVKYGNPAHDLVGLVKSTQFARRRGECSKCTKLRALRSAIQSGSVADLHAVWLYRCWKLFLSQVLSGGARVPSSEPFGQLLAS